MVSLLSEIQKVFTCIIFSEFKYLLHIFRSKNFLFFKFILFFHHIKKLENLIFSDQLYLSFNIRQNQLEHIRLIDVQEILRSRVLFSIYIRICLQEYWNY